MYTELECSAIIRKCLEEKLYNFIKRIKCAAASHLVAHNAFLEIICCFALAVTAATHMLSFDMQSVNCLGKHKIGLFD